MSRFDVMMMMMMMMNPSVLCPLSSPILSSLGIGLLVPYHIHLAVCVGSPLPK